MFLKFDSRKMGDDDISRDFRQKLDRDVENFHFALNSTLNFYNESLNLYSDSMQKSLDEHETFFKSTQLMELNEETKKIAVSQV